MARAKDKCFSYMDVTKKMAIKAGDILFTEKSPLNYGYIKVENIYKL